MPGITALRKVQIGQEAIAGGTTDPASTIWRGMGALKDNLVVSFPEENIGILGNINRSYIAKTGGEIQLTGDATYEQLGYFLQSGIKTVAPTTDTSSAKVWTWAVQTADTDPISTTDLTTLVIEGGDNQQAEIMRYGFTRELELSASMGQALAITGTIEGRGIATGSYTSGLSIPTVESILFPKGLLYIDPSTDTIGSTLKSNTLMEMSLKMTSGWRSVDAADGRTDFSFIKRISDEMTLDLTFEHDSTSVAEKLAWRSETERAIRLKFTGSALSTTDAGAPYDTKALVIDLYGKWQTFESLDEQDGNDVVRGTFRVGYSTVAAAKATFVIVNELASLP